MSEVTTKGNDNKERAAEVQRKSAQTSDKLGSLLAALKAGKRPAVPEALGAVATPIEPSAQPKADEVTSGLPEALAANGTSTDAEGDSTTDLLDSILEPVKPVAEDDPGKRHPSVLPLVAPEEQEDDDSEEPAGVETPAAVPAAPLEASLPPLPEETEDREVDAAIDSMEVEEGTKSPEAEVLEAAAAVAEEAPAARAPAIDMAEIEAMIGRAVDERVGKIVAEKELLRDENGMLSAAKDGLETEKARLEAENTRLAGQNAKLQETAKKAELLGVAVANAINLAQSEGLVAQEVAIEGSDEATRVSELDIGQQLEMLLNAVTLMVKTAAGNAATAVAGVLRQDKDIDTLFGAVGDAETAIQGTAIEAAIDEVFKLNDETLTSMLANGGQILTGGGLPESLDRRIEALEAIVAMSQDFSEAKAADEKRAMTDNALAGHMQDLVDAGTRQLDPKAIAATELVGHRAARILPHLKAEKERLEAEEAAE
ncbi:MAG: hypothetical protein ABII71_06135 [Candidatus Micrarchaeota archaeon]